MVHLDDGQATDRTFEHCRLQDAESLFHSALAEVAGSVGISCWATSALQTRNRGLTDPNCTVGFIWEIQMRIVERKL